MPDDMLNRAFVGETPSLTVASSGDGVVQNGDVCDGDDDVDRAVRISVLVASIEFEDSQPWIPDWPRMKSFSCTASWQIERFQ